MSRNDAAVSQPALVAIVSGDCPLTSLLTEAIRHRLTSQFSASLSPAELPGEFGLEAGSILRRAGLPPGLSPLAVELAYYSRSSPL